MAANRYKAGTAIYISTTVKNTSGVLTDTDTATIMITDPAGTVKVNGANMTRNSVGSYSYICQTASDWVTGFYIIQITAVLGSYTSIFNDIDLFEIF